MAKSTKPLNYKQVDEFVKTQKNPTYSIFKTAHPKSKVSRTSFGRRKNFLQTGKKRDQSRRHLKGPAGYHRIDYTVVDKFIRQQPDALYQDFKAKNRSFNICLGTFNVRRKKILGQSVSLDKPQLYMRLWSGKCSDETIKVIRSIITVLNKTGRARIEAIELSNPSILEIREAGK